MRNKIPHVFKQHKQLIPLLILTIYSVSAIIASIHGTFVLDGKVYNYELTTKHYLAFSTLAFNFLIYIFLRKIYKFTLALTILTGLFNLMTFPAFEITQSFSLNSLKVSFQPSAFWAGLVACLINFNKINTFIPGKETPKYNESKKQEISIEQINMLKEKYKDYSNESLTAIIIENKRIPIALEAAKQLLEERKANAE